MDTPNAVRCENAGKLYCAVQKIGFAAGEIDDAGRTSELCGHIVKSSELLRFG